MSKPRNRKINHRNPEARALARTLFRQRTVLSRKTYRRQKNQVSPDDSV